MRKRGREKLAGFNMPAIENKNLGNIANNVRARLREVVEGL